MNHPNFLVAFLAPGLIFLISFLLPSDACARFYTTLFWMNEIPQSRYGHVAHFPEYQMYIGIPLISSIYVHLANSGFSRGDMLRPGPGNQRYWDINHFTGQLNRYNHTMADLHLDIGSFGFRRNRNFYSFAITHKASMRAGYTPDLVRVTTHGSDYFTGFAATEPNLNNLAFRALHYREFSAGVTRQVLPDLTIGLRGKLLTGLAGIFITNSNLELLSDPTNRHTLLNANILVNASPRDTTGLFSDLPGFLRNYLYRGTNPGFSLDIGATYRLSRKMTIALSLLDAGFIWWGNSVRNLEITGESVFEAIPVEDLFDGNMINNVEQLIDDTSYDFISNSSYNKFWHMMQPGFLASASYDIGKQQKLSVFSQVWLFNGKLLPTFSIAYNIKPGRRTSLTMSYSHVHLGHSSAGLGFSVNIGPVQLYLVSDHILAPLFPYQAQMANFHAGVNLVPFEKRIKRKKYKNIPGLYCWD